MSDTLEYCDMPYDLKDILMIREVCDSEKLDSWWGLSKHYLLKDISKIPPHLVLEHQSNTKMHYSNNVEQSSNELNSLVFTFSTNNGIGHSAPISNTTALVPVEE